MYKYFKDLDKLKEYSVWLSTGCLGEKIPYKFKNYSCPSDFFLKYNNIFEMLDFIIGLVVATNEELSYDDIVNDSYENWMTLGCFFAHREEEINELKYYQQKIDLDTRDLENLIWECKRYCDTLIIIYPNFKDRIILVQETFENALSDLKKVKFMIMPPQKKGAFYTFPDSWYITPNNYLYNTGSGHKQGNLIYPFYNDIKPLLENNKNIPRLSFYDDIKEVVERGYITSGQFSSYTNLMYKVPTILTPEVMHDAERYKNIVMNNRNKLEEEIIKTKDCPHPERSYQRNLINLIVGWYAAKTVFYQSFCKLNESKHKKEIIAEIAKMRMDDIFVKFSGFHKISSVDKKTITTSDVQSVKKFSEYLNRGWNLDIIPGLIYDKYQDKLVEMDFNWEFIDRYFNKVLSEYEGKGRIRIRYDDHMRTN